MDNRAEIREFLTSRRARISPGQAGLPVGGGERRVPGLRRTEVAMLAGVSVEYYSRLERGALAGVSASVLNALATALQLDDAERSHLMQLAQTAVGGARLVQRRRTPKQWNPSPSLQWVLDAVTAAPAIVRNGRMDLLATNPLGRAMHASLYDREPTGQPNFARYTFLDEDSRTFYPDWDGAADICVSILRTEAGRDPHDKDLHDLVGELSTRSAEFRRRWSRHDVRLHGAGTKHFHHHAVGALALAYESVELVSEPGLTLTFYAAEPGSTTEQNLRLLSTWEATRRATSGQHEPAAQPKETSR